MSNDLDFFNSEFPSSRRTRSRSKRRVRSVLFALIKLSIWIIIISAVFIMGIGFGKTIGGESEKSLSNKVTIKQEPQAITATMPTRTETVTKTVTKTVKAGAKKRSSKKVIEHDR